MYLASPWQRPHVSATLQRIDARLGVRRRPDGVGGMAAHARRDLGIPQLAQPAAVDRRRVLGDLVDAQRGIVALHEGRVGVAAAAELHDLLARGLADEPLGGIHGLHARPPWRRRRGRRRSRSPWPCGCRRRMPWRAPPAARLPSRGGMRRTCPPAAGLPAAPGQASRASRRRPASPDALTPRLGRPSWLTDRLEERDEVRHLVGLEHGPLEPLARDRRGDERVVPESREHRGRRIEPLRPGQVARRLAALAGHRVAAGDTPCSTPPPSPSGTLPPLAK